jgi:hypothetical protein
LGRKFRRKVSCGFQKPQETITYKGFSWEPESAGNSAGNVFPADFLPISAEKSAGNMQISSSVVCMSYFEMCRPTNQTSLHLFNSTYGTI